MVPHRWVPKFCISNKLPSDAGTTDLGAILRTTRVQIPGKEGCEPYLICHLSVCWVFKKHFHYLFLAALGPHCCRFSLVAANRDFFSS